MAKISVIGSGSWGTALTWLLCNNGHELTLWSYRAEETEMYQKNHQNTDKLPGVILPDSVEYTTDLGEACVGRDLLVLAVPSPALRNTAHKMSGLVRPGQLIVSVAKGIEENSLMTMSEIIEQEIPQADVAVLSGQIGRAHV